nr:carbohydrate binding domain-containing protein precursor [Tanacetum cinerariifolium]
MMTSRHGEITNRKEKEKVALSGSSEEKCKDFEAFQADQDDASVVFTNSGMEDDPKCGPIIDDIVIKKLFVPTKSKGSIYFQQLLKWPGCAKAEKTRVAFYSVYYNTRSDDMSSLCGHVVDDIRFVVSIAGTEESRVEPIKEEEEKAT